MLTSEHIALRPLERSDLEQLAHWRNDPSNHREFFNVFPIALSGQPDWYADLLRDSRRKLFVIETKVDRRAIGTIGFDRIDWRNQSAELGNILIDAGARGHGLASEAVTIAMRFAFEEMNLHRLYLEVFAENTAAIRVYERCGFQREATLREAQFRGGRFCDVVVMAVLRSALG
jgi:diamine N-acetyltransferase